MTPIAPPLAAILADPAWLAMDATARGYHMQLLLIAAGRSPAGTLPGHEPTLRRYLGLGPTRVKIVAEKNLPNALEKFLERQDAPIAALVGPWWLASEHLPGPEEGAQQAEIWAEHLWQARWRPMVMAGWQEIDDELIERIPHLARAKGGYYSTVAAGLAEIGSGGQAEPIKQASKKARGKKSTASKTRKKANPLDPNELPLELAVMGHDLERFHDAAVTFSRWSRPLDEQGRRSLWDVGVTAMTGPDATAGERTKAKSLLGKLIKDHGEAAVAEAVAQLAVRAVPVADAASFLAAMLRNKEEGGSPMEQKARGQRARVAL